MTDNSYINWYEMTDKTLSKNIGDFIKHHRLNQNKTQIEVSKAADISRSTLSQLEHGEKIALSSLIKVLRVLDLLYIMDIFKINTEISPIEYAKVQKNKRQRARTKNSNNKTDDLGW